MRAGLPRRVITGELLAGLGDGRGTQVAVPFLAAAVAFGGDQGREGGEEGNGELHDDGDDNDVRDFFCWWNFQGTQV